MRLSLLSLTLGALPAALAEPQQPPLANTTALPSNIGMLVFPGFQALDVFGPLDALNMFSGMYGTGWHLEIIGRTLDPAPTNANVTKNPFREHLVVTSTFKDILAKENPLDVLIVPGGSGTRDNMDEEIAFVKEMYPKVKYILTVCTGATIAARAGILDGRKATTNKRSWQWATSTGPKVDWQHVARWVADGNIWSSSGVSAGMDLTLAWVGHLAGEEVADYVAMSQEYTRAKNSTDDPFAGIWS